MIKYESCCRVNVSDGPITIMPGGHVLPQNIRALILMDVANRHCTKRYYKIALNY
jgi:copper homeostasis protein CutC